MNGKIALIGMGIFCLVFTSFLSVNETTIPIVDISDLAGNTVSTGSFSNEGKPYVIVLWATWNKNAVLELTEIKSQYELWQKETGCKVIAVSIDDVRNKGKVKPFVEGREWKYEVYSDVESKFKTALEATAIPVTYVVNSKNKMVWSLAGFEEGDLEKIYSQLKSTK